MPFLIIQGRHNMFKKTLATFAVVTLLSTSAFAGFGSTTNGGTGGSATQEQTQFGINKLKNAGNSESKSGVKDSGNSKSKSKSKSTSGVKDSGNSANLNTTKQKTDASSETDIDITGDNYDYAEIPVNSALAPIALSNDKCSMGNSLAIQGKDMGASAGGSVQSTDCVANENAIIVSKLLAKDKDLSKLIKAELCTGKQHREAFEATGIDKKYCVDKKTYLGLKPIVSGIKELLLSPIALIKWIINA